VIRLFALIIFLLSSCSQNNKNNLSKKVDFSDFYNLSMGEYIKKLEDYNESNNYPNIDK
tara:strand:- start:179 stop:355 length:177 start_codon:yes stop_codon:yes gene_type:complete